MKIEGMFAVRNAELDGKKVEYETSEIVADGKRIDPEKYQDSPHACTEFQWGYGGSGPAFTAYVLLLLATGDAAVADRLHQQFKWQQVAQWQFGKPFSVEVDVDAWVALQERKMM